jgi:hypothetical protein
MEPSLYNEIQRIVVQNSSDIVPCYVVSKSNNAARTRLGAIGAKAERVLADFDDAGHFYDWGFLLPLCKITGPLMIRVHASKPLTVIVKQGHLPVMVLSPCVFPE